VVWGSSPQRGSVTVHSGRLGVKSSEKQGPEAKLPEAEELFI